MRSAETGGDSTINVFSKNTSREDQTSRWQCRSALITENETRCLQSLLYQWAGQNAAERKNNRDQIH